MLIIVCFLLAGREYSPVYAQGPDTPTPTETPTEVPTDAPTEAATASPTPSLYLYATLTSGQPVALVYEIRAGEAIQIMLSLTSIGLMLFGLFVLLKIQRGK